MRLDENNKYCREDRIHKLIMPMRVTSNDVPLDASNLWVIDERLAFHNFLASDKSIRSMPITDADSLTEPDILALKLNVPLLVSEGQSLPLPSIVVVEFKRPMRKDVNKPDQNPIDQCLNYLQRVRDGEVYTATGRPIPGSAHIPGYCYIIADLTEGMISACKNAGYTPTQDGMGYFGYNPARQAYIEVISFDQLVNAATERNRAFFDKLGLPSG